MLERFQSLLFRVKVQMYPTGLIKCKSGNVLIVLHAPEEFLKFVLLFNMCSIFQRIVPGLCSYTVEIILSEFTSNVLLCTYESQ